VMGIVLQNGVVRTGDAIQISVQVGEFDSLKPV
jgi:MOSC domain-containing protein YiiM